MDVANPFPYVLGRPPALGGSPRPLTRTPQRYASALRRPIFREFGYRNGAKRPSADDMYWVGFYKIYEQGCFAVIRWPPNPIGVSIAQE